MAQKLSTTAFPLSSDISYARPSSPLSCHSAAIEPANVLFGMALRRPREQQDASDEPGSSSSSNSHASSSRMNSLMPAGPVKLQYSLPPFGATRTLNSKKGQQARSSGMY